MFPPQQRLEKGKITTLGQCGPTIPSPCCYDHCSHYGTGNREVAPKDGSVMGVRPLLDQLSCVTYSSHTQKDTIPAQSRKKIGL